MSKALVSLLLVIFGANAEAFAASSGDETGLLSALRQAEAFSPRLKTARFRETAFKENIRAQKSNYYPDVSAAAVASTGEPGSFSMFDVDSDMSATSRLGVGGALVLKQDIWDFGRTSGAVHTAEAQHDLQEKEISLLRLEVDAEVLKTYLGCSFLRAQVENSRFMADQARVIAQETGKFVRSGQRSVIERYLVDAEAKEAETRIAEFSERVEVIEERLGIELGKQTGEKIRCGHLYTMGESIETLEKKFVEVPLLEVQKMRIQLAQSKLEQARADSRPWLVGIVTGGYFDNDHLANRFNYSAGIGLKMPLFEGFRIDSKIKVEAAGVRAEESGLDNSQLSVHRANSRYDEQIRSLKVRLEFLDREKKLAKDVLALARKRYGSLQGTMIDLREAIHNMNRVLQSTDEAYRDLYQARGERSLLNGSSF